MKNDDLPSDLLRLVEQDERQILSHQEITEAINLGTEEERKKVKIRTTLSPAIRKELIDQTMNTRMTLSTAKWSISKGLFLLMKLVTKSI